MINPKDPSVNPIQSIGATKVNAATAGDSKHSGGQSSKGGAAGKPDQQHSQNNPSQPHKNAQANKPVVENPDAKRPTQSPQQQGAIGGDRFSGKWDQYIGSAKTTWGKLTDDELLKSEGNMQKLSGLVKERYALSRDIADTQVKKFLDTCNSK
jgi:uncharacterized protein YjbJ (UPF0337 family)